VYKGPGLVGRIKRAMVQYVAHRKLTRITDACGRRSEEWASRPLDM
jgi:dihydroorotate dehydrogenase